MVLLYSGAEVALNSSEKLGLRMGLSPLAIGMVLVGMGTSLPEFFVSHIASMNGNYDMAIGNIIGSNIANTFLILSISSIFASLPLGDDNLKENLFFHLVLSFLIALTFLFQKQVDMTTLVYYGVFFLVYLYFIYRDMKQNRDYGIHKEEILEKDILKFKDKTWVLLSLMVFGFYLLYLGGDLLVESGSRICKDLGVSEYVISVIFVSFGTSLPELVTSIMASIRKKHTDIIVGNIIGSNIFNVALILGSLGIYSIPLSGFYHYEVYALVGVSVFLLLLSLLKSPLNKISGVWFLFIYVGFLYYWVSTAR